jgi:hypothetical protein
MKHVRFKNVLVLVGLGFTMFMCGMAYEHYATAYVFDKMRVVRSVPACGSAVESRRTLTVARIVSEPPPALCQDSRRGQRVSRAVSRTAGST